MGPSYELALSDHLHIHNVFHVSLLKNYIANPDHILDLNDTILVNQEEFQAEPEQVLDSRQRYLRGKTITDVLIQWKGYTIEDASWEDWDRLVVQFPNLRQ